MTDDQRTLLVRDSLESVALGTVRGTRMLVSIVLGVVADGMSEDEILEESPTLTDECIRVPPPNSAIGTGGDVGNDVDIVGRRDSGAPLTRPRPELPPAAGSS